MDKEREFKYIVDFLECCDDIDGLMMNQAVCLWTAFCLHNDLIVDTDEYDVKLITLYLILLDKPDFEQEYSPFEWFDRTMSQYLV